MASQVGRKIQLCRGVASLLAVGLGTLPTASPLAEAPPGEAEPLVVTSTLERLSPPHGGGEGTSLEPGAGAAADQFVYTARFTNRGTQVLDGLRITSPIPAELRYLAQSASGAATAIVFSTDQGRTFGSPAELEVAREDGTRRAADPADYTHVRWVVGGPLDPGATGVVRFAAVPR